MSHLVDFKNVPWSKPAKGIRFKKVVHENQQIRLVEFSYGFIESDWCLKGHAGYVLEGTFSNDYSGEMESYRAGDVILIPKGEKDKHKAVLKEGERVTLLLFEVLEDETHP